MKELVRCKACGYVMEKTALGEVCPACGVKAQMFEPYQDKIGQLRHFILDKHLHPVVVHAPQALVFLLVILAFLMPLFPKVLIEGFIFPTLLVLSWILPFAVLAGICSGLFDAKVRFRKLSTPLLLKKVLLGLVFLVISLIMAILITFATFSIFLYWISYCILALAALGVGAHLGILGAGLTHAAMPGDKILLGKKKKQA